MRQNRSVKWMLGVAFTCMIIFQPEEVPVEAAVAEEDEAILTEMEAAFENGDSQVVLTVDRDSAATQAVSSREAAESGITELCDLLEDAALSQGLVMTAFHYNYKISTDKTKITYKFDISDKYTQTVTKISSEKNAYQRALKALKNRDYTSAFYSKDNKYYDTFVQCLEQHPEYNYGLVIWKSANGSCGYRAGTYMSSSEIKTIMKKTDTKVNAIAKKIFKSGMTSRQKLQAIHDYLVENCIYNDKINVNEFNSAFTAYGCLIEKTAVCQGYAAAFNLLANKAGVPSVTVTGVAGGTYHGWNMVKLGSSYRYVDVTWDDPLPDRGSKASVSQQYFLLTQSALAKDHSWNKTKYAKKYLNYQ